MRMQYPDTARARMQVLRHACERGPAPVESFDTWVAEVFSDYQRRMKAVADAFMGARPYVREDQDIVPFTEIVAYEVMSDGRLFHAQCVPQETALARVNTRDLRLLRSPVCAGCGAGWYE